MALPRNMSLTFLPGLGMLLALLPGAAACRAELSGDVLALVQGFAVQVQREVLELGGAVEEAAEDVPPKIQRKFDSARWPSLDHAWDEIKESADSITSQVGDVADQAVPDANEASRAIVHTADDMVRKFADALNHALSVVLAEANDLLKKTMEDKLALMRAVNSSIADVDKKVLPEFAAAVDKLLDTAQARWTSVKDALANSVSVITSALGSAGQGKLAGLLTSAVDSAEHSLDAFMQKLRDASKDVQGLGQKEVAQAQAVLFRVNEKLNDALEDMARFLMHFQHGFQELIDTVSGAVVWSDGDVDRALASVQHNVTSIAWRARSSSRELVLGVRQGILACAKAEHFEPPPWQPVAMPVYEGAARGSTGLGLLAALIAGAALGL